MATKRIRKSKKKGTKYEVVAGKTVKTRHRTKKAANASLARLKKKAKKKR